MGDSFLWFHIKVGENETKVIRNVSAIEADKLHVADGSLVKEVEVGMN